MSKLTKEMIYEKIYAGFIGKAIGVRLGAPVEPTIWSYERIQKTYGEVTQYLATSRISPPMTIPMARSISSVRCMTTA
ncbi:ADP-ribosylglycohydrolase family protein (plasmid) [Rhizobium sp. RCAM05350]|nr:ADP-ribosylglycohydrolase family protein [Rhizobium sp. RCAM05350]